MKQKAFLSPALNQRREVFYGGAAGGAKSAGLLMGALQYVDVPGYDALILRRTFKQLALPGALMARAREWLDPIPGAHWQEGRRQWRFPSGATLTFGYLGKAKEDRRNYESAEFNYIAIDELTAFDEDEYRFMFSRLRRSRDFPVPSRMRSASNPGGRGHQWVKARLVQGGEPGAVFIPAYLGDNPHLDREDYIESLRVLHPTTWRRLLYGDWETSDPGEMFQPREWYAEHPELVLDAPMLGVASRIRYWDFAASEPTAEYPDPDWTAGLRIARLRTTPATFVIEHALRLRRTAGVVERVVHDTALSDPNGTRHWMEQEPGAAGKSMVAHYNRTVMPQGMPMKGNPARTSKGERARPLAGAMEQGRVYIVRGPWNEAFFDELEAFSEDPAHTGPHDDQVDAASGAFQLLARPLAAVGPAVRPRGEVRR